MSQVIIGIYGPKDTSDTNTSLGHGERERTYVHDHSVTILRDRRLIACLPLERLTGIKHDNSIERCITSIININTMRFYEFKKDGSTLAVRTINRYADEVGPDSMDYDMFKKSAELLDKHQGDNPVLIRIETNSGHGAGTPVSKQIEQSADIIAFTLYNMGVDDFKK